MPKQEHQYPPIFKVKRIYYQPNLSPAELEQVLDKIPIAVRTTVGYKLPLKKPDFADIVDLTKGKGRVIWVEHSSGTISLKPPKGKRLLEAIFYDAKSKKFQPSMVMHESTGSGACCTYAFNTKSLGLPFDYDMMLDIYKLG
jgi:hypothetical protein